MRLPPEAAVGVPELCATTDGELAAAAATKTAAALDLVCGSVEEHLCAAVPFLWHVRTGWTRVRGRRDHVRVCASGE